jgi:hypothetical protein
MPINYKKDCEYIYFPDVGIFAACKYKGFKVLAICDDCPYYKKRIEEKRIKEKGIGRIDNVK